MRKVMTIVMIFLLAGSMGCEEKDTLLQEEYLAKYDMNQDYNGYYPVCEQNNVYYFILDNLVRYYDANMDMSGILCDKAECEHAAKQCNAYIGLNIGFCLYDDCLYWLASDAGILKLYSMDLEGNRRHVVQDAATDYQSGSFEMDIHRGCVYTEFMHKEVVNAETMYRVEIIQQEIGKPNSTNIVFEKSYAYPMLDCVFGGNYMYFSIVDVNKSWEVYQYDVEKNVVKLLYQSDVQADYARIRVVEKVLYIANRCEHDEGWKFTVGKVNLKTGKYDEVVEYISEEAWLFALKDEETLVYKVHVDGKKEKNMEFLTIDYEEGRVNEYKVEVNKEYELKGGFYDCVGLREKEVLFVRECYGKTEFFFELVKVDLINNEAKIVWSEREGFTG